MNIIETRDLTHVYRGKITALDAINFTAKPVKELQ